jgi:hypothetical protein
MSRDKPGQASIAITGGAYYESNGGTLDLDHLKVVEPSQAKPAETEPTEKLSRLELARAEGLDVHFPSPQLCTDNAAMVAAVGYRRLRLGESSPFSLNAEPNLLL